MNYLTNIQPQSNANTVLAKALRADFLPVSLVIILVLLVLGFLAQGAGLFLN